MITDSINKTKCKFSYFTDVRTFTQEESKLSYMKNTTGQRINARRKALKMRQEDIAILLDVNRVAISQWERDETQPNGANLFGLAKALKTSASWIIDGMDLVGEEHTPYPTQNLIPIIGRAQLGDGGFWEAMDYPTGHGDGYIQWYSDDPHAYAVQGVGESMSPRIKHNEFVIVEPNRPVMNGDEVFLATHDGRRMIKIFLYARDNRVHLESTNNDFEKIIVEAKDVQTMHYVAGIAKAKAKI